MKIQPLVLALAAAVFLAGCDTVRDRFSPPVEPHVRVFSADQKATYAAARSAIDQMGYRFLDGGPAAGRLSAVSEVSTGESLSSSLQRTLKATFEDAPDGNGTQVSVRMTEIIESGSEHERALATETPLRDTSLYEVFFRLTQQGIAPPAKQSP